MGALHSIYHLIRLKRRLYWSEDKLERLRQKKLADLLEYCYNRIPYYRKVFQEIGARPGDFQTPEDLSRFPVGLVRAVIADQGIGHRDDLLVVGRIREDFLVAGHARIEYDLPARLAHGAERGAFKNPAVFQ